MDALPPSPSLSILLAIRAEVVRRETMEERVRIMSWMIEVGSHLRRLNNFNSLMYFLAGLSAPGVYRLKQVWRRRVTCGVGKDRVAGGGGVMWPRSHFRRELVVRKGLGGLHGYLGTWMSTWMSTCNVEACRGSDGAVVPQTHSVFAMLARCAELTRFVFDRDPRRGCTDVGGDAKGPRAGVQ